MALAVAATTGAPEPDFSHTCKSLYVGNLDPRVTETLLSQVFQAVSEVVGVKIRGTTGGANYGFVDFADHAAAALAMQQLNGRKIYACAIRVNWAYAGLRDGTNGSGGRDTFSVFVGDLAPEIGDAALAHAFERFPSMYEARVMWDSVTCRSRGYGFVSFRDRSDAEAALKTMNGVHLGSRALRLNWATARQPAAPAGHAGSPELSVEAVAEQTAPHNVTVYVGNLPLAATQNDLYGLVAHFGYVAEIRHQPERGFAFVRFDTHENAARAIVGLSGFYFGGRALRCNWGRERAAPAYPAVGPYYGGGMVTVPFGGPTHELAEAPAYVEFMDTSGFQPYFSAALAPAQAL